MTVNRAPLRVGIREVGFTEQVPGTVPVQLKLTLEWYLFSAVSVPFQVMFCPAKVVLGVSVTASAKSPVGAVTVSVNVCVFAAGAPVTFAESVTVLGPPVGVFVAAVTV